MEKLAIPSSLTAVPEQLAHSSISTKPGEFCKAHELWYSHYCPHVWFSGGAEFKISSHPDRGKIGMEAVTDKAVRNQAGEKHCVYHFVISIELQWLCFRTIM